VEEFVNGHPSERRLRHRTLPLLADPHISES
jgi:hypothetical protein